MNCTVCKKDIQVMAFRGTGFCSVACKKEAGIDHPPYGDMMIVTKAEAAMVHKRRRSLKAVGRND